MTLHDHLGPEQPRDNEPGCFLSTDDPSALDVLNARKVDSGSSDASTATESVHNSRHGAHYAIDVIVLCNDDEKSAQALDAAKEILQDWSQRDADRPHENYQVRIVHLCTMSAVVSDSARLGFADCTTSCGCTAKFTNLISSWKIPVDVRVQSVVPSFSTLQEVLHLPRRVVVSPLAVYHGPSSSKQLHHSKLLCCIIRQTLTLAEGLQPPPQQSADSESPWAVTEEQDTPFREERYRAVLLLASEKWEPVVDWGVRLAKPGESIRVVHFIRGPDVTAQSAEMQLMARRRARMIDPSVPFDIHVVRIGPGEFLSKVVELSKMAEFLVVGDSGRVQTRHRDIILQAQCDVILARSVIPPAARAITDMVVGVGARDAEGAMNALGLAYRIAEISECAAAAAAVNVAGVFVPVVMHADSMLKGQWQMDRRAVLVNGTTSTAILHRVEQFVACHRTDTVSFHLEMGGYSDSLQVAHRLLLRAATAESQERHTPPLLFVGTGSAAIAGQLGSVVEYLTRPDRGDRSVHSTTVAIAKCKRCDVPCIEPKVEDFMWNTSTETYV
ncbi:hypothetical protein FOZ61_010186 [Perkinsus olseni]|uniref:Uncharacterized protein n=1 Tax=Perkinsus olseni TaxID=32597 RepID=A0A7J6M3K5_PEROL|nr:hypothetical protein FOZ61_010186 [Perkinsus olseni]